MGLFLAATVMSSQATTIIVTVSNVPPVYEGESILITGSALYSELLYPVSGAATTVTLGGETSNTHTIAGGTYSVSMGPLSAGEYSACVYITDTSVEGSNCLAISVLAVASNQTITFPAIADQLSTHYGGIDSHSLQRPTRFLHCRRRVRPRSPTRQLSHSQAQAVSPL